MEKKLEGQVREDSRRGGGKSIDRLLERYAIEPGTVSAMGRVRRLLGTKIVCREGKVRLNRDRSHQVLLSVYRKTVKDSE